MGIIYIITGQLDIRPSDSVRVWISRGVSLMVMGIGVVVVSWWSIVILNHVSPGGFSQSGGSIGVGPPAEWKTFFRAVKRRSTMTASGGRGARLWRRQRKLSTPGHRVYIFQESGLSDPLTNSVR